jgi:hypothetical protein
MRIPSIKTNPGFGDEIHTVVDTDGFAAQKRGQSPQTVRALAF